MTKEDKQRVIGKLVAINTDRFTVELLSGIDNFNINGFDDIHYFAQLNSYVVLPYQNYYIIAEVAGIREKDLNNTYSNPTEQILSKVQSGKFLEVFPIGTLKPIENAPSTFQFDFGVSVYPALYTDALYIKESELDAIFNIKNKTPLGNENDNNEEYEYLSIGKSTIFPDYDIKISLEKFFGNHSAILGNTGSGKSCTISSILQNLYKYKNYSATGSSFIIFDVNGEYSQAFSDISTVNSDIEIKRYRLGDNLEPEVNQFVLPHWYLTIEEWGLLLKASEKTQLPILRNALGLTSIINDTTINHDDTVNHIVASCILQIVSVMENSAAKGQRMYTLFNSFARGDLNESILDKHGFSVQFGNFQGYEKSYVNQQNFVAELKEYILDEFIIPPYQNNYFNFEQLEELLELSILWEEAHGNKQIRDYCAPLLTRYKSLREIPEFAFLTKNTNSIDIDSFTNALLGVEDGTKKNQVILIDLNSVDDEIVEVISCVITRMIFDKLRNLNQRNSFPVNLILEEAHRYISINDRRFLGDATKIFDRVAKEGRKFGLLLLLSSQRPSELSETVLSQCSNFIVHRIQNPADLSHIRQITPHISEAILRHLPSIPNQHALIFGHAVNLPATFKVNNASPLPKSESNKISQNWFKAKGHSVDI